MLFRRLTYGQLVAVCYIVFYFFSCRKSLCHCFYCELYKRRCVPKGARMWPTKAFEYAVVHQRMTIHLQGLKRQWSSLWCTLHSHQSVSYGGGGRAHVIAGQLPVSKFIAFSSKADDLMELLVGDQGLAGVKRQFDVSCAPLTNLLKLQTIEVDPLQEVRARVCSPLPTR